MPETLNETHTQAQFVVFFGAHRVFFIRPCFLFLLRVNSFERIFLGKLQELGDSALGWPDRIFYGHIVIERSVQPPMPVGPAEHFRHIWGRWSG